MTAASLEVLGSSRPSVVAISSNSFRDARNCFSELSSELPRFISGSTARASFKLARVRIALARTRRSLSCSASSRIFSNASLCSAAPITRAAFARTIGSPLFSNCRTRSFASFSRSRAMVLSAVATIDGSESSRNFVTSGPAPSGFVRSTAVSPSKTVNRSRCGPCPFSDLSALTIAALHVSSLSSSAFFAASLFAAAVLLSNAAVTLPRASIARARPGLAASFTTVTKAKAPPGDSISPRANAAI